MKQLRLIIMLGLCGLAFLQCKKQPVAIDEALPEEVDPLTTIDSVTTGSQNIKLNGYQAQCFEKNISLLNEREPFTINDHQTYKRYLGCHDGDLPAIDFSKQTLLIANIPRTCIPGFLIEQSIESKNGHLDWNVKFPPPAGCNDGTFVMRQICYLYDGVINKENVTLSIQKYN
ncbi:hypothetical protein [Siphonobacter sp. BAB-5405]|uniref:hypothetical protein n=1 Tax=Siphonobacter sp. BAB-5405 TaxID=1864825 RepID=UPI0011AF44DD|nr:hypothetical protein [Siphonobacter sp. BAB-5405]